MNIPILSQLVSLIEKVFETHAPEIVAMATSPTAQAVEQVAAAATVQSVEQDPKVQTGIAVLKALQEFKTAINAPPTPPVAQ